MKEKKALTSIRSRPLSIAGTEHAEGLGRGGCEEYYGCDCHTVVLHSELPPNAARKRLSNER
jgi:hypothetical protein